MLHTFYPLEEAWLEATIEGALQEDLGEQGDITSTCLSIDSTSIARLLSRETCVLCGKNLLEKVFQKLDNNALFTWYFDEGALVPANSLLVEIQASTRALLAGERTAMNFLQIMSGTATTTYKIVKLVEPWPVKIYDTRKTIPLLRPLQKYAVSVGGGFNHRSGLWDAVLIKENHIAACGSITAAIQHVKHHKESQFFEVEVETLDQLKEALSCGIDIVLLDNMDIATIKKAVSINQGQCLLEASGNINSNNIALIAQTGVDRISIGLLTKNLVSIDLSMRLKPL